MQLFKSNWSPEPSQPANPGYGRAAIRLRYGGRGVQRRNENGLLAVVERHREELHRHAAAPRPVEKRSRD